MGPTMLRVASVWPQRILFVPQKLSCGPQFSTGHELPATITICGTTGLSGNYPRFLTTDVMALVLMEDGRVTHSFSICSLSRCVHLAWHVIGVSVVSHTSSVLHGQHE